VESAKRDEEQAVDAVGRMLSSGDRSKQQRAFKAWSHRHVQLVKDNERDEREAAEYVACDVAKSAVTSVCTLGAPAPSAIAPPRDMRLPRSIGEANNCPAYGTQWRQAIANEFAGLEAKNCYETVKLEAFMKPLLNFSPIFKVKFHSDGTLDKFKVRLVIGGHKAIKGQHFEETFSPVLSIVVLRLILATFAAYPHVVTTVADVEQAYLWSKLEEEVYVRAPTGLVVPEGHVLKLLKAIYGMPQAGREFWKLLCGIIVKLGFKQSDHAHCFFYRRTDAGFVIIMTYVDDITITTDDEVQREEITAQISKVVTLEKRGVLRSFLGMQFDYNKEKLFWRITQPTFVKDLCASMDLYADRSKAAFTPEIKRVWSKETSEAKDEAEVLRVSEFNCRSKVGSILWCIVCCRPDLMHCVKNPSQYMTNPGDMVVTAIKRIGRYMLGTAEEGLQLQGYTTGMDLHVASDADDAGGTHRRSMLCYMQWLGPALGDETELIPRAFFQWNSAWSIPVASGSMESEIYGIYAATKGAAPNRGLLGEIGLHDGKATSMAVDSASSKTVLQGEHAEKNSAGIKHIDRRVMAIRQLFAAAIYTLVWVSSLNNPADIGATFKGKTEFERLRGMVMGYVYPRALCEYLRDTEETHWSQQAKKDKQAKKDLQLAKDAQAKKDLQLPNGKKAKKVKSKQAKGPQSTPSPATSAGKVE
jgi:hypothetical protein